MNRRERRKNGIKAHPKTLVVTEQSYVRTIKDVRDETKKETIKQTLRLFIGVLALSLNNEFAFGQTRINRLVERMNRELECINAGTLSKDDVENWCRENNIKLT